MAIAFNCPKCGKRFDMAIEMAGKKGRCGCGTVFVIPAFLSRQQRFIENFT